MSSSADKKKKGGSFMSFAGKAIGVVVGIVVTVLAVLVAITIFAHKARVRCSASAHNGLAISIIISTILMWFGGFVPVVGVLIGPVAVLSTIILVVVGYSACKTV